MYCRNTGKARLVTVILALALIVPLVIGIAGAVANSTEYKVVTNSTIDLHHYIANVTITNVSLFDSVADDVTLLSLYNDSALTKPVYFHIRKWDTSTHTLMGYVRVPYIPKNSYSYIYFTNISTVDAKGMSTNDPNKTYLVYDTFNDAHVNTSIWNMTGLSTASINTLPGGLISVSAVVDLKANYTITGANVIKWYTNLSADNYGNSFLSMGIADERTHSGVFPYGDDGIFSTFGYIHGTYDPMFYRYRSTIYGSSYGPWTETPQDEFRINAFAVSPDGYSCMYTNASDPGYSLLGRSCAPATYLAPAEKTYSFYGLSYRCDGGTCNLTYSETWATNENVTVITGWNAEPIPDFSCSPTVGMPPFTVICTDASTFYPDGWYWSVENTSSPVSRMTSTSQNPSFTFSYPGLYNINMVATNQFGGTVWRNKTAYIDAGCAPYVTYPFDNTYLARFNVTNSPRACNWTPPAGVTSVWYLVVAGGGGGGSYAYGGGGGGGGGVLNGTISVSHGTAYVVSIGAGGLNGTNTVAPVYVGFNGTNSSFSTKYAAGGGGGGGYTGYAWPGGSGGGGSYAAAYVGGAGISGQGYKGGNLTGTGYGGAGGGGRGGEGLQSNLSGYTTGGRGGPGFAYDITGISTYFAGGGGGGNYNNATTTNAGGEGGGGHGGISNLGQDGTDELGGGGGGSGYPSAWFPGGTGGDGVVLLRWGSGPTPFWTLLNETPEYNRRGYDGTLVLKHNNLTFMLAGVNGDGGAARSQTDVWNTTGGNDTVWRLANATAFDKSYAGAAVSFNGRLFYWPCYNATDARYLNTTYYSDDGIIWTKGPNASWSTRVYPVALIYNDSIYVMGGVDRPPSGKGAAYRELNDTWVSRDGFNWTQLNITANWLGRYGFAGWIWNDRMYITGGTTTYGIGFNDTWYSTDGQLWIGSGALPATTGSQLTGASSAVFDNKIWLLGGTSKSSYTNTTYSSIDGFTWVLNQSQAEFPVRSYFPAIVDNYRMQVFNGIDGVRYLNDSWQSWPATSPPNASFTKTNTSAFGTCLMVNGQPASDGCIVGFYDTSTSNTVRDWCWTVSKDGGGTTILPDTRNPTYRFSSGGNYSIALNASNEFGGNISPLNSWVNITTPPRTECSDYVGVNDPTYCHLILWWKPNTTNPDYTTVADDLSFFNNNGTLIGSATTVNDAFKGYVYQFRNGYIATNTSMPSPSLNDNPNLTESFTFAAWINSSLPQAADTRVHFASKRYRNNVFDSTGNFTSFDLTTVDANAKGFRGAAFDGRFLYLIPFNNTNYDGLVARYDSWAQFDSAASWTTYDIGALHPDWKGFRGSVFDGRYLYLVPYSNASGSIIGSVVRYDTSQTFASPTSWSAFDTKNINPNNVGFASGTFDGRYIYFASFMTPTGQPNGRFTRYDTLGSFSDTASWTSQNLQTFFGPSARGFRSVIFDGRYLYLFPFTNARAVRYDTTSPLTSITSYQTFDMSGITGASAGFRGLVFDRRYIYAVPYGSTTRSGNIVRYDTQSGFQDSGSYSTFDLTTLNANYKGYVGATFDGRYIYYSPAELSTSTSHGYAVRYDTTNDLFTTPASYSVVDLTGLSASAKGFRGVIDDGAYIYYIPSEDVSSPHGTIVRYSEYQPLNSSWSFEETTEINQFGADQPGFSLNYWNNSIKRTINLGVNTTPITFDNTWVHVALTFDKRNSTATLYINGVPVKTGSISYGIDQNVSAFQMFNRNANLTGTSFRLYDNVLSANQVMEIYDYGELVPDFNGTPRCGLAPLSVYFVGHAGGAPYSSLNWSWDFNGDGTFDSYNINDTYTYTIPGRYEVRLRVNTTTSTQWMNKTEYINVANLIAKVTNYTTPLSGPVPLTVTFNGSQLGTSYVDAWSWDMDNDGGIDNITQNASYTYTLPGIYTVNLTIANCSAVNTTSMANYVNALEAADFNATPRYGTAPQSVVFVDMSTTAASWSWDIDGDGIVDSTSQNYTHLYTDAGAYTINHSATGANTLWDNRSFYVIINNPIPGPNITFNATTQFKTGGINVSGITSVGTNITNPDGYIWVFGDETTTTGINYTKTFTDAGVYFVNLSVTDSYGTLWNRTKWTNESGEWVYFDVTIGGYSYMNAILNITIQLLPTGNTESGIDFYIDDVSAAGSTFGFESGDLTGWSTDGDGTYDTEVADTESRYNGVYGGHLTIQNVNTPGSAYGEATIGRTLGPLAGGSHITGWYQIHAANTTGTSSKAMYILIYESVAPELGEYIINDLDPVAITSNNKVIITNSQPVAIATENVTTQIINGAINFSAASSTGDNITGWLWLIDGTTQATENWTKTFATSGLFPVNLSVIDSYGTPWNLSTWDNSTSVNIINDTPTVSWHSDVVYGTVPFNVQFTDDTTGGGVIGYNWTFGDGGTSQVQNPTHQYTVAGAYNVTFNVSTVEYGQDFWFNKSYRIIAYNTAPVANFVANTTIQLVGYVINFTSTSTGTNLSNWTWTSNEPDSSTDAVWTDVFSATGSYTIAYEVWDSPSTLWNQSDREQKVNYVTIVNPVAADFSGTPRKGGRPLSVTFTDLSVEDPGNPILTWSWDFGDGNNSVLQNPVFSYGVPGWYDVSLTVATVIDSDTETKTGYILVNNTVTSAITSNVTAAAVCVPVQFTSLANGANITNYFWTFGDGGVSVLQNPTHTYSTPGAYTVTHTAVDSNGTMWNVSATSTNINYITASWPAPSADFHAVPTTADAPLVAQFTDDSVAFASSCGDPIVSWSWNFGDSVHDTVKNPMHTYVGGTYDVSLTVTTNSGATDTMTKIQYIHAVFGGMGGGGAGSGGEPPHGAPGMYPNASIQFNVAYKYDIYNGTFFKYWLFNLTHYGEFNIQGLAYSMMLPIIGVFGYWIFLIIWLTYLATVWIRSQDLVLPLVIGLITAGVWGVLIPAEAYLYVGVMFAICIAVILVKLVWSQY